MKIEICVGSSCHLKGSHEVINLFQESLAKHDLEADIELAGSFCMGNCSEQGVSVRFDDGDIVSVTPANFHQIFNTYVLGKSK